MGVAFDLMGHEPTSPKHSTIRFSAFRWRPLWNLCHALRDDLVPLELFARGQHFDGAGLDAEQSRSLAESLDTAIDDGTLDRFLERFAEFRSTFDLVECEFCAGAGIRCDDVGLRLGLNVEPLDELRASVLGRDRGTCNACDGLGRRSHEITLYSFDRDDVSRLAEFLRECGGFSIT